MNANEKAAWEHIKETIETAAICRRHKAVLRGLIAAMDGSNLTRMIRNTAPCYTDRQMAAAGECDV